MSYTSSKDEASGLTTKQVAFCKYYVELNNGLQAATKAGYSGKTAAAQASRLLTQVNIQREIGRLRGEIEKKSIATAQDVMEFFTRCMNGEEKDQFGLDISASDKIKAAVELAKRTVDIDNRAKGHADQKVEINLNWKR